MLPSIRLIIFPALPTSHCYLEYQNLIMVSSISYLRIWLQVTLNFAGNIKLFAIRVIINIVSFESINLTSNFYGYKLNQVLLLYKLCPTKRLMLSLVINVLCAMSTNYSNLICKNKVCQLQLGTKKQLAQSNINVQISLESCTSLAVPVSRFLLQRSSSFHQVFLI